MTTGRELEFLWPPHWLTGEWGRASRSCRRAMGSYWGAASADDQGGFQSWRTARRKRWAGGPWRLAHYPSEAIHSLFICPFPSFVSGGGPWRSGGGSRGFTEEDRGLLTARKLLLSIRAACSWIGKGVCEMVFQLSCSTVTALRCSASAAAPTVTARPRRRPIRDGSMAPPKRLHPSHRCASHYRY